jgi:Xaa-Pro dipeptidase
LFLQFEERQYHERISAARGVMRLRKLDALLVFAPESLYYLTGLDTTGFVFFQCGILTLEEEPVVLLTRRPDLLQAQRTSIIRDVRLWFDAPGADPSRELQVILEELGLARSRIGIELDSFGLRASSYEAIRRRFQDWCSLEDGSSVVRDLRLVKSSAELAYVRRAAELADTALIAMIEEASPGKYEGDISAAGARTLFQGGCDPSPSGPVIGSGDRALLVRATTNYRHLDAVDQLTMEFSASYKHYCTCLMRTIAIGKSNSKQHRMFDVTHEALLAMTEAARPGRQIGQIDEAHRQVFDQNGFGSSRMSACGYSLGATFRPSWMDVPPMIYSGNETTLEEGMVFFLHAILADKEENLAMSLGYTIIISRGSAEVLSKLPIEYIVRP